MQPQTTTTQVSSQAMPMMIAVQDKNILAQYCLILAISRFKDLDWACWSAPTAVNNQGQSTHAIYVCFQKVCNRTEVLLEQRNPSLQYVKENQKVLAGSMKVRADWETSHQTNTHQPVCAWSGDHHRQVDTFQYSVWQILANCRVLFKIGEVEH